MRAKLYSRQKTIKEADLSFDREITMGRGRQNNVVLDKKEVSKKHLRIFFDESRKCFFLEDFGSANGTHLDNIRVEGKEQLRHLNVISIAGLYDFIFQDIQGCKARHPGRKQTEASLKQESQTLVQKGAFVTPPKLAKSKKKSVGDQSKTVVAEGPFSLPPDLEKAQEKSVPDQPKTVVGESPFILPPDIREVKEDEREVKDEEAETVFPDSSVETVQFNPAEGILPRKLPPARQRFFIEVCLDETRSRRFALKEGENVIGRKAPADIIIEKREVSRRHAVLILKDRSVFLRDAGSKNKTFVDGKEISETLEIQADHELRFGVIKAKVVAE